MRSSLLLAACCLVTPLLGCASSYRSGPLSGTVVDADTLQSIPGANVLVSWTLEGGLEGGNNFGQLTVQEAVTDSNGRFSIPPWGPKKVPRGKLHSTEPGIIIFKNGYEVLGRNNHGPDKELATAPDLVRVGWNGTVFKLKEFKGDVRAYKERVGWLDTDLWATLMGASTPCAWREAPKLVEAMAAQQRIWEKAGIEGGSTFYSELTGDEARLAKAGCGSVSQFIREHQE